MVKKRPIIYPLFVFLYPVLSLWTVNVRDVSPLQIYRGVLVVFLFGVLSWLVSWLIFRCCDRAALVASVFFLLFFSYGHLYNFLYKSNTVLSHHRIILPAYGLLALAWGWMVLRNDRRIKLWSSMFKVIGPALLILPAYTLGSTIAINVSREKQPSPKVIKAENAVQRPDIYYIILDGYGSGDMIQKYYDYDNSGFLGYLRGTGFYVADHSRSNYISTILSLSSSLNMQYVDILLPKAYPLTSSDAVHLARYEADLLDLVYHSQVRDLLAANGYRLIAYDNNFKTTIRDADVLLTYSPLSQHDEGSKKGRGFVINGFEGLLLETSIACLWVDWMSAQGMENIVIEAPYSTHRAITIDMFESLKTIPAMEGDNFVFMHFLVPHPPFVFGPNGEINRHDQAFSLADGVDYPGTQGNYIRGYTGQLTYLNKRLKDTIDYLIENSDPQPIIVIQGDHGPRKSVNFKDPKRKDLDGPFGILNAYYLPGVSNTSFYPTITPVNSFRVVFNSYFGVKLDLLPDENYLLVSKELFNYDFVNVTEVIE